MSKVLLQFTRQMQWALVPLLLLALTQQAWGQCNNTSQYPGNFIDLSATNSSGVVTTITACNFSGEYSALINAVSGNSYRFTSSISTDYFTIRSGSPGGPVVGSGTQPLTVTPGVSGNLYAHINSSSACLSDVTCRATAVQCISCAGGGCVNSTIYPSLNISLNPTNNSGAAQVITTCQFCGEYYSVINVIAGKSYTFSSSVGTDWITVRVGTYNGSILGQGAGAVVVTPPTTATLFIHTNTDASCGTNLVCRTSSVQCTNCICQNSSQFPSTAVSLNPTNTSGAVQTVTSCNFASEYFVLTNVLSPKNYTITSSVNTDWLTVRIGSPGGPVLAQGQTPLAITTTSTSDLYVHVNTNSSCGTSSACRITSVQCTNCAAPPPCVTSPTSPTNGQTNICPSATQTLSWPASPGATSYDVYFGTTNPPPFVGNTAATSYVATTPGAGTRYWQIRPVGPGGTASGCNVWSFTKQDVTPPTITCPANVTGNNNPATACSAVMTYGSVSASDACGAPSIVLQSGLPSGSVFPVGVNTVVFRATDGVGLTATCSFTVTVNDVTLPTITCPANITGNNDPGVCGAIRTYPTPAASDNCAIQSVTQIGGLPSGSTFPVGTTTNTWRATDVNNNTRTCAFTVSINDVEAPELTCPPDLVRPNDAGQCSRVITNLGQASIDDNCIPASLTNNSPVTFPVGTTQVTYVLADNSGNTATCMQSVTVYDQEYPGIICPSTIVALTDEGDCVATVDFSAVTVVDNCPGYTVEYSADPLSTFDIGYSSVTATITDASGNASNCTFLIHVKTRPEVCNDFDDDCDGLTDEAEEWAKVAKRIAKGGGAFDEYGIAIDVDGDWAVVGSNKKNAAGQTVGTAYILRRSLTTPEKWVGITSVLPDQVFPGDGFGLSVAVDSNVIAVGAPFDDESDADAGAVYLYQQSESNPNAWILLKKVLASGAEAGENLGSSLSLDGGWLAAGAPMRDGAGTDRGAVHLFARDLGGPNEWGHSAQVDAPDGEDNDWLGASVSLDAGRLLAGAPGDDDKGPEAGAAYVFQGTTLVKKISGNQVQAGDQFGRAVALSGAHAVVGAPYNDLHGDDAGAAFSFYQHAGGPNNWGQWALFSNNFSQDGDNFGSGVALDGEYAVITAPNDDPFGSNSGMGHVYLRVSQGWAPLTTISSGGGDLPNEAANFGHSVAMDGRTIAVGAWHDQTGVDANRGSAYFFEGVCAEEAGQRDQNDEFSASIPGLNVQCRPVPFDDVLTIEVTTSAPEIRVTILNTLGQEVTVLNQSAVPGRFDWQAGKAQPGLYFVRVQAGDLVQTKSVVLARP